MKLKRFNKINENSEMYFVSKTKSIEEQKFEIIEKLSQNWSEKLKQDYLIPRSLYHYSLDELKNIENKYLNETSEEINENVKIVEPKNNDLENTLKELKEQHLSNEAVEDIRLEGNEIIFDVNCETEIQGITEYNGVKLKYNKLCSVPKVNDSEINEEFYEEIDEDQIFEQINSWKIKL